MLPFVILLVVLLLLSGFFSSSETAFLSLQRVQLEHMVRQRVPGAARVARMLDRPHSLLSAILLGNNLTNTAAAAVGTALAVEIFSGAEGPAVLAATVAITILLVVFGEVGPKALALSYSFRVSRAWALPLAAWLRLTAPAVWLLDALTRSTLRLFRSEASLAPGVLGSAELRTAIRLGVESGTIERVESGRLLGALTLEERQIQEIMTPRVEIVSAAHDEPLRTVADRLGRAGFLRLPVYRGSPDEIVGYVHVSDVNVAMLEGLEGRSAGDVTRPITFESEHSSISHVLELMRERGSYLVMLVDEFGTTSGLVTLEDIMEEVVGNLRSESGEDPEDESEQAGGRVEVEASRLLVDLSNELGSDFTDVDANTVAGLVLSYTHRFPTPGESVEHAGHRITVIDVDERRILRVAVEPIAGGATPDHEGTG